MKDFGSAFTAAEDKYLQEHYLESTSADMAAKLKRPLASTQNRIRHLGLKKKPHAQGKPDQKKLSVFLEMGLYERVFSNRGTLSVSGYIQELVRKGLPGKKRAA